PDRRRAGPPRGALHVAGEALVVGAHRAGVRRADRSLCRQYGDLPVPEGSRLGRAAAAVCRRVLLRHESVQWAVAAHVEPVAAGIAARSEAVEFFHPPAAARGGSLFPDHPIAGCALLAGPDEAASGVFAW